VATLDASAHDLTKGQVSIVGAIVTLILGTLFNRIASITRNGLAVFLVLWLSSA
jgi:hypothetical protein